MRSKYYLADRLPGYLINLSLLNDRYWAGSLRSTAVPVTQVNTERNVHIRAVDVPAPLRHHLRYRTYSARKYQVLPPIAELVRALTAPEA
jgi:hypothetical protein